MCLSAPKPIQSYHIACSHHSSDIITRIELMVSEVGFPSVVSHTGRNLIFPCQCWFSCLMKAKLSLSQPVIKSRLLFFFFFLFFLGGGLSGKICLCRLSPACKRLISAGRSICAICKTPSQLLNQGDVVVAHFLSNWMNRCFHAVQPPPTNE